MEVNYKELYNRLICCLQKSPPIHIELYPVEVLSVCWILSGWLIFHPKNRTIKAVTNKLKGLLKHNRPELQKLINDVLDKGVKTLNESIRN
ncbi:MAG: hypothetical protein QNJ68_03475 [Microcoleaceae cyanobacterium MO_207.B10]|nr:hypothetical protein [Microcoleaceae cyanobacterium MO_207.B10]